MSFKHSLLTYVDDASLKRLSDKNTLDNYLIKEKKDTSQCDIRFLMNDKLKAYVGELVKELPEEEKAIIRLRYWNDLSLEEIGIKLNKTLPAIERSLVRTLADLREKIKKNSFSSPSC